ncbi:MAG: protein YgfX [Arenimonas sp.]
MSSPPFDATIDLAPRPSLRALAILFWLHTAILALALVALPPGPPLALLAAAVAVSWFLTRRHPVFGHGRRALTRLTWHADGTWTLHDAAGARFEGELQGSSLVHDWLLVLNFRLEGDGRPPGLESGPRHSRKALRTRALLGDEIDAQALRRLRVRLRLAPLRAPG